jgi:hypothetical protein
MGDLCGRCPNPNTVQLTASLWVTEPVTYQGTASAVPWTFYILRLDRPDLYQGTTSVVPTIPAGIKGFSPCAEKLKLVQPRP